MKYIALCTVALLLLCFTLSESVAPGASLLLSTDIPDLTSTPASGFHFPAEVRSGNIYFVSMEGSDANPGTEMEPFHTINQAAKIAIAGDKVIIRAGIYYEDILPQHSGVKDKYITYMSYGDGEVIIDAQNGLRAGCIEIENKSYLQFVDLTVRGANSLLTWPRAGISITDGSNNIILDNITAYNNYFGIMAYGKSNPVSFITVKNSMTFDPVSKKGNTHYGIFFYMQVYDSRILNNHVAYTLPEAQSYGVEVSTDYPGKQANGPRRIVITGNEVDHNESQGIHIWNAVGVLISKNHLHDNGATGINIEDGSENIVVEQNISENNAQKYEYETGIWADGAKNVVVRNNVVKSNKIGLNVTYSDWVIIHDNYFYLNNRGAENLYNAAGLFVRDSVSNVSITQNTFVDNGANGTNRGGVNFGHSDSLCNHITFINNIVSGTASAWDLFQNSCAGLISDYNDFFNSRPLLVNWNGSVLTWPSYLATSSQDLHSLNEDPQFVNPIAFDFRLQPASPLLGKGAVLARTTKKGEGDVITVTDASFFSDGFGVGNGDDIIVGGNRVKIVAINYVDNIITIDQKISWNGNDAVSFPFAGLAPDIGVSVTK